MPSTLPASRSPLVDRDHALALARPTYFDAAELRGGEVAVFPVRQGVRVEVSFASPYEDVVLIDGERLTHNRSAQDIGVRIWVSRRLLALYQALGTTHGIVGAWGAQTLFVHDVVDKADGAFADHREVQRRLASVKARLPPFAVLGEVSSLAELSSRTRALYAAGTQLEVRHEDAGVVFARRLFVVGRH